MGVHETIVRAWLRLERESQPKCPTGKRCFPSRAACVKFTRTHARVRRKRRQSPYRCKMCSSWHVATLRSDRQAPRVRARRAARLAELSELDEMELMKTERADQCFNCGEPIIELSTDDYGFPYCSEECKEEARFVARRVAADVDQEDR